MHLTCQTLIEWKPHKNETEKGFYVHEFVKINCLHEGIIDHVAQIEYRLCR